jgi:hypothetical protein
MFSATL